MSAVASLHNVALERRRPQVPKHAGLLLQRKCACGAPTASMTGECVDCKNEKRLQTKLAIGASHDPLEREADRVADEVLATPAHSSMSRSAPRIQRFTGQATGDADMAPASVDRVLASAGNPLAPALQSDMEQRFGYDFSQVRVHADAAAEQSTREVNAHAYTVGRDIVFGAGRFAPATHDGRRLIAHELTHVVQQTRSGPGGGSHAGMERRVQRDTVPAQDRPSARLSELAKQAIDELDDDQRKKVLISTVLSAGKLGELRAFASILKARPHKTYGNYFIFLITELESDFGSQIAVGLLKLFADANVDVTKDLNTFSLQPLAAVAKFKSLAQRYKAVLLSGKVSDADKQRIGKLIADAQAAIRDIERPARQPGAHVQAMGGVAIAAGALWKTAGALAADDATGIGVADDVLIPFVIVGAAVLSGIALFMGGPKPVMLDYRPVMDKVNSALMAMAAAVEVAVQRPPRPRPPPPRPQEKTPEPREVPATPQPRPQPEPQPKPTKTIDVVPSPPTATEQDKDEKKKRKRCRPEQEPCAMPLPIRWPRILPLPRSSRPLVRTPSGDPYIEPEARSGVQEELQRHIRRARAERRLPPNLCNQDDAMPNAPYDAHHMHPLFLGGAEDWVNVCALRADYHQDGHPLLYDQRDMLEHPVWIACKVCQGNLRRHPALQEYEIEGRK
jgi:hypothetical protein